MKALLFAALLLVPLAAHSDTIDLQTSKGAGNVHQYHDVNTSLCNTSPCDPESQVTIYISVQASATYPPPQNIQVWFDDDVAHSYYGPYYGTGVPTTLSGASGQVTVTLNETSQRVCTHSGRGQHCAQVWTLQSGTIVR